MIRSPRKVMKRDYRVLNDGIEGGSPSKRARKSGDSAKDIRGEGSHHSPVKDVLKRKLDVAQKSPPKSKMSPNKSMNSPSKSMKSPSKSMKSPTKSMKSPIKSVKSPTKSMKSPTKSMKSPTKSMNSPTKSMNSLTKSTKSPTKSTKSPTKSMNSPTKSMMSPTKSMMSPTKSMKSPTKSMNSPTKSMMSPTKSMMSPTKSMRSPQKSLSLFKKFDSCPWTITSIDSPQKIVKSKTPSTPQKTPQKSTSSFYGSSPRKTPQKVVGRLQFDNAVKAKGTPAMPKRKSLKSKPKGDVQELYDSLPCRKKEIDTLLSLLGERGDEVWPSLFLYGHTATGKTKIVTSVLENQQLPFVNVNLVECYTNRLMYEHILNSVSGEMPSPDNDYTNYAKCDNMNDFVIHFKKAVQERELEDETVYIVLDHAERLRDMDAYILPAFTRLQELTQLKVCVILISEIVWEKFRFGTGCLEPIVIHIPDYSQDDLMDILLLDCPEDFDEDFYSSYLNLLLSVFYSACRDLRELRHLATLNFPKYIEPIKNGEAKESESRKLWRNIEPHLRKALHSVYLREVSSAQWEKMQLESGNGTTSLPVPTSRMHVELPYYSKYLLIAAYLASYNPAKSDQRFFMKKAERKVSRQAQLVKKNERTSSQLLGPKAFPLDRLMAIFYSIVEGKVLPTAYVYSQIASLVTLRLIAHVGGDDQLDGPKYKCVVSLDFVKSISRTIGFEVMRYLYDFV